MSYTNNKYTIPVHCRSIWVICVWGLETHIYLYASTAGAGFRGGGHPARAPLKIGKNMIFWRKIVIFHTKYPQNVRASLRSAQFFKVRPPPLTWNSGFAPAYYPYASTVHRYCIFIVCIWHMYLRTIVLYCTWHKEVVLVTFQFRIVVLL